MSNDDNSGRQRQFPRSNCLTHPQGQGLELFSSLFGSI
jgi:hypothetical protein